MPEMKWNKIMENSTDIILRCIGILFITDIMKEVD